MIHIPDSNVCALADFKCAPIIAKAERASGHSRRTRQ
jgi:hypothetical protein